MLKLFKVFKIQLDSYDTKKYFPFFKKSLSFKVFLFPGFKRYFKELSKQNMCQDAQAEDGRFFRRAIA